MRSSVQRSCSSGQSWCGLSFIHYGRLNLDTDYSHWALARALQGLGYAFFFVPLSVLAYSELSPEQNNKASSLTNFFRNWGGSFGIALVTTVSERRSNFHQSVLGASQSPSSHTVQDFVATTAAFLEQRSFSHADAMPTAFASLYHQLGRQAHFQAFMDCFDILAMFTLVAAPLALYARQRKVDTNAAGGALTELLPAECITPWWEHLYSSALSCKPHPGGG